MSPRRRLLVGAVLTALGLAVAMTSPLPVAAVYGQAGAQQVAGGLVLLLGWGALAWGIHCFGRAS